MPPLQMTLTHGIGRLEMICGPMFSGKTEELIRRVRRVQFAKVKSQIFKPAVDNRYDKAAVVSHSAQSLSGESVTSSFDILLKLRDSTRVVAIDEVQFLDEGIIQVVDKLANRGIRVICAGLDLDYQAQPFGPIPQLLAIADDVTKVSAICVVCGAAAGRSQRLKPSSEKVVVGAEGHYEARCREHFELLNSSEEHLPQTVLPLGDHFSHEDRP